VYAFLAEWLFVVAMLVSCGAVSGFAIVPFRHTLPFAVLAAPLAGLLVMAFGASLVYHVLGLPFLIGCVATATVGILATAWTTRRAGLRPRWRSLVVAGGLVLLVAAVVTPITVSATIEVGGPALHYWTGTDHLGYAHPADWIIAHPPSERPRVDPTVPYESWPALMLESDPRFGSLAAVALIAVMRGLPSTFAYDVTCAVALSASVLGVAAVFARSRLTLGLLVLGLLTCHWYDYSRAGYLGRTLGFPSGCLVVGLFLATRSPLRPGALVPILLLAGGTAAVYPADATGLFIGVIGGAFVVASVALCQQPLFKRLCCLPWQHLVLLGLIAVVALGTRDAAARRWSPQVSQHASLGTIVRSLTDPTVGEALLVRPWEDVRPTLLDLEQGHAPIGMLGRDLLNGVILLARVIWLALIVIAVYRRDPAALALTLAPLLLLTLLNALPSPFARWLVAQLPGTFYPFTLFAAALLLDGITISAGRNLARQVLVAGLVALLVVSIGLRVPRFLAAVDRYVGTGTRTLPPFALVEMDGLAEAIGSQAVRIDLEEPHLSLMPLVELGRRGIDIQWGPKSWRHVAGYRGWPPPEVQTPTRLDLRSINDPLGDSTTVVYQTRQFRLVRADAVQRP
jgi:hypothetical protein